jgi:predicted DNA-binding transcriptional regulator AlpA
VAKLASHLASLFREKNRLIGCPQFVEREANIMKLLAYEDLQPVKGIRFSKVQLWRNVRANLFPAPIKVGQRNYWPENEIDSYLAEAIAQRDAERAA